MTSATVAAHAKLNVFLRVLGRRDDGLHDIETLILPLELCDDVTVHLDTGEPGVRVAVRHEVDGPRAPDGAANLAALAVLAFADAVGAHRDGVRIEILKRIPVAAGMGGGSADAAAVLTVLGADRDIDPSALRAIGAMVGADVPALVHGGPVFASGMGDALAPVHAQTTHWVVRPLEVAVGSGEAYGWWDEHPSTGPDTGAIVAAFETGNDDLLGSALFDDLQAGVARRHPAVTDAIDAFLEAGALGAMMTGSGPTVVALARHLGQADALAAAVPASFVTSAPPRTMGPLSGVV